jgi:hypothetical protein
MLLLLAIGGFPKQVGLIVNLEQFLPIQLKLD